MAAAEGSSSWIFVSYNSRDRPLAERLVEVLERGGLSLWFDQRLPLGSRIVPAIEEGLRRAAGVLVLIGPSGEGPWHEREYEAALVQSVRQGLPVIPVLLPGLQELPELPLFLQGFTWLDLRGGIDDQVPARIEEALPSRRALTLLGPLPGEPAALAESMLRARSRLIISGHTLDRFADSDEVKTALIALLDRGVKLSLLLLNPLSSSARAHLLYHELESSSPAQRQFEGTLAFLREVFDGVPAHRKENLEVILTQQMPRFRAVIADEVVSLYLYMYGVDVAGEPDLVLTPAATSQLDRLRSRVIYSTLQLLNAPEGVPYIRCGQIFEAWRETRLAAWSDWTAKERLHHRLIHEFYVTFAQDFDQRFGHLLEAEVQAHLAELEGPTLVLGCGSGKEVAFLAQRRPGSRVIGLDFSHVAIELAKRKHPDLAGCFLLSNFYDLEHCVQGPFQSVVANAAFIHLYDRRDLDPMLRSVGAQLAPGGRLLLRCLYKERDGEPIAEEIDTTQKEWTAARWYLYFSRRELAEIADQAGFEVLDEVTRRQAQRDQGVGPRRLTEILEKGYRHIQHRGVFWPTLLLRKR